MEKVEARFVREGNGKSPSIVLDNESGVYEIKGSSYPEDVVQVYDPVYSWFDHYGADIPLGSVLKLDLDFINTSSIRSLYMLFREMARLAPGVGVLWKAHDEDMRENVQDIQNQLNTAGISIGIKLV